MTSTTTSSAGALYYPYIHIEDPDWLRANLIIFPCVKRMVPANFTPRDKLGVAEFTRSFEGKKPLLQAADLWSDRAIHAQDSLAKRLKQDSKDKTFVARYGQEAARKLVGPNDYGFQIHVDKLSKELREALTKDTKLAWQPINPETWDGPGYVEVHPKVGEAVMSTIAVACAKGEGLDIVGDERSGQLHECLLEKNSKRVYDAWLNPTELNDPKPATGEELVEFILGIAGDLSVLSIEKIHQISAEREPINALLKAVREHAVRIPTMDEGENRDEAFKQAASEVLDRWDADRRNFSGFAREFFGLEAANLASGFATKIADKTLGAAIAASAGWLGSLAGGGLIGAGAGLVIGLITHGGVTYVKQGRREKSSPYRFLTTLETAGVFFRCEAR
jgi:hypothetical protein